MIHRAKPPISIGAIIGYLVGGIGVISFLVGIGITWGTTTTDLVKRAEFAKLELRLVSMETSLEFIKQSLGRVENSVQGTPRGGKHDQTGAAQ